MNKLHKLIRSWAKGKKRSLSVLNGVFGDSLEKTGMGLSVKMELYADDRPLPLTKDSLRKMDLPDTGKICILAHGNCGSERGWRFDEDPSENYGSILRKDFGHTPFFLRYNSGLHIFINGKRLSDLLERLVDFYPHQVREMILVGHSMGGLVFRSACHYGEKEKRKWVRLVRKIFYLGSPHLGTHFEKLGKLTTTVLNRIPNPFLKIFGFIGEFRSAGIKDLRHGYLTEEDCRNKNADHLFYWPQNKTPLLQSADHYLICGTLSTVAGSKMGRLFGDGLVHPASATGQGLFSSSAIPFLPGHCKIILGISHTHLQRSRRVYEHIRAWCESKAAERVPVHSSETILIDPIR